MKDQDLSVFIDQLFKPTSNYQSRNLYCYRFIAEHKKELDRYIEKALKESGHRYSTHVWAAQVREKINYWSQRTPKGVYDFKDATARYLKGSNSFKRYGKERDSFTFLSPSLSLRMLGYILSLSVLLYLATWLYWGGREFLDFFRAYRDMLMGWIP